MSSSIEGEGETMGGPRRAQSTTDRPGYLIKRAQAALNAQRARARHEHGATLSQFAVLTALADEPGLSNAELARRAFITPQSMNENLRELEQRGWIVRSHHPTHGRIRQTELTEQGRATLQACDATVTAIEQRMLAELDIDQRHQLAEALRTCIAALNPAQPEALKAP
jgi:DNA-binding MarR family transcriptional regulator